MRSSAPLYDLLAPDYDQHFAVTHRRAYDDLAWEICAVALPQPPATVVDVGCGVGRWAERLLEAGYTVTGIEPAPAMAEHAIRRLSPSRDGVPGADIASRFTLVRERVEDVDLEAGSIDVILAMGSLQYTREPAAEIGHLAGWLRPGGILAVLVDSLQALALELVAAGKEEEALTRLTTRRGVWRLGSVEADLHLLDSATLRRAFADAGLDVVTVSGLLVGASAFGREALSGRLDRDFDGALATERRLAAQPDLADLGKQLLIVGRRQPL